MRRMAVRIHSLTPTLAQVLILHPEAMNDHAVQLGRLPNSVCGRGFLLVRRVYLPVPRKAAGIMTRQFTNSAAVVSVTPLL